MWTSKFVRSDSSVVTSEDIMSVEYVEDTQTEQDVSFGGTVASSVKATLRGILPTGIQAGEEILYYRVDDSGTETLIGHFFVEKPEMVTKNTYTFTAYDPISLLDKDLSGWLSTVTFPRTLVQLAGDVCTACGLTFATSTFPNSSYSVAEFAVEQVTGRQLLSMIATLAGRYVRATSSGTIEFAWYSANNNTQIAPQTEGASAGVTRIAYYADSLNHNYYQCTAVTAMRYTYTDDGESAVVTYPQTIDDTYNVMDVSTNLLLTGATVAQIRTVLSNMLSEITSLVYVPCKFRVERNSRLQAGDIVSVVDANGYTFNTLIMKYRWTESGLECESTGNANRASLSAVVTRLTEPTQVTQVTQQQAVERVNQIFAPESTPSNPVLTDSFVQEIEGAINITGFVTFTDLSQTGQSTINGANITTGSISSANGDVTFNLDNAYIRVDYDSEHYMQMDVGGITFHWLNNLNDDVIGGIEFFAQGTSEVNVGVTTNQVWGVHEVNNGYSYSYYMGTNLYGGEIVIMDDFGAWAGEFAMDSETSMVTVGKLCLEHYDSSDTKQSAGTIYGIYHGTAQITENFQTITYAPSGKTGWNTPIVMACYATDQQTIGAGDYPSIKIRRVDNTSFQIGWGGSGSAVYPVQWVVLDLG